MKRFPEEFEGSSVKLRELTSEEKVFIRIFRKLNDREKGCVQALLAGITIIKSGGGYEHR